MDVFETERCLTGSCPSWSHFAQGGHGLQPRWDTCLFLCTAGTADSRQSSLGSSPSLRAWIRARQLAARQVRGILAQAASHHFIGAVYVCGLCS